MRKSLVAGVLSLLVSVSLIIACSGGYSFTGGDVGEAKTYSVYRFPNQAKLINPNLSIQFTENLKQEILEQTPLQLVERGGDLEFSGSITGYAVTVGAPQGDETNSQNRLTVTVKVSYLNNLDTKKNFDQSFSRFRDYDASLSLTAVEDQLVSQINDELAQDIINKALVNW
jgi:hypothetical protein